MRKSKAFILEVLDQLQLKKLDLADVRLIKTKDKSIATKDNVVEAYNLNFSMGFGIRVCINGSWGFSAAALQNDLTLNKKNKSLITKTIKQAIDLSQTASIFNQDSLKLKTLKPIKTSYKTGYKIDPFSISDNKIIDLLLKADKALKIKNKIKISQAFFSAHVEKKIFANLNGSFIDQEIMFTGAGIEATAVAGNEVQNRTYPNSFRGQFETKGYEAVEKLELLKHAPRVSEQAIKLISAPNCPSGEFDLIIDGNQLALQVHESIGHAVEFDRILGLEASFAGTSFVKPSDINNLTYASPVVNVTADATIKGALGSFGFDDEGMPAKRQEIIKKGKLVGVLTNKKTAKQYNLPVTGAMRAQSWNHIPLIRMTNINLEPGNWELKDLIADTKKGLFLTTNRSWSIDDKRDNFQFGTELAIEIKNGRLGKIYKNPIYADNTLKFWQSCDAICNKKYWQVWGTPNCGKGEPTQTMHVGHGTAPTRFRNVKVFPGKANA
ncbi:TldD/PmbA family protein [Patescibacteria group bacterium]